MKSVAEIFSIDQLEIPTLHGSPKPSILRAKQPVLAANFDETLAWELRARFQREGAMILRGLALSGPEEFAAWVRVLSGDKEPFQTGEHPVASAAEGIYRPVEFAQQEKLLWHHENTFNKLWPQYIFFYCASPARSGGETSIVDGRIVFSLCNSQLREKLATHGIAYIRNCDGRTNRTWQQIYNTDDPARALTIARENDESLEIDGKSAKITAIRRAFFKVEEMNSWFNQLLHWHPSSLPESIRPFVASGLIQPFRDCHFGNGEQIGDREVQHIRDLHQQFEFRFGWREGDIIALDNRLFSHGREPFDGHREHFVAFTGHCRQSGDSFEIPQEGNGT